MFASLSIYGLYTYDNSLFDNLVLPAAFTDQEKDDTILTILSECSDLALLYPDFDFMKMLIGVWSRNELHIWSKMLESERIEFNPIENYDRYESISRAVQSTGGETDSRASATTGQADRKTDTATATTGSAQRDDSGSSKNSGSNIGNTEGTTGQTAYDSDTIKDTGRSRGTSSSLSSTDEEHSGTAIESNSSIETGTGTTAEKSAVQESETGKRETNNQTVETVTNHTHGNIGVTQAADMLERFRQVSDFCTIDFIVNSFKDRFCVQVY